MSMWVKCCIGMILTAVTVSLASGCIQLRKQPEDHFAGSEESVQNNLTTAVEVIAETVGEISLVSEIADIPGGRRLRTLYSGISTVGFRQCRGKILRCLENLRNLV